MKTRRQVMMTGMATTALAVGVGSLHSLGLTAEAQQGHMSDPQAHFDKIAERLALTASQRESLAQPFHQAFAAMEELHRLHDVIAAELSEEQKGQLREMIHAMLSHSPSEGHDHARDPHGHR
ncbi:MAG TPA: hypothetical protein VEK15_23170 [Vicinamibacteria bacterium]|nr:hypothetical protein [Vicinamibacteria bacterium]